MQCRVSGGVINRHGVCHSVWVGCPGYTGHKLGSTMVPVISPQLYRMKVQLLLSLLTTICLAQQSAGPLPQTMIGKFNLESSTGFDDYMYKLGVGWFKRKVRKLFCYSFLPQLVCASYPELGNLQSEPVNPNGEITISYYTPIGSTKIVFFLDTPFQVLL